MPIEISTPKWVWDYFFQITQIPRPSGQEEKIRRHFIQIAEKNGLKHQVDSGGNLVNYVPGTGNKVGNAPVIIQNHLDMVTVKEKNLDFNFETDSLQVYQDEKFVMARGTTLGADNGLGCAAALALIHSETEHPPLELLFTVDEETGLNGVWTVDPKNLTGKTMLNLDTEDWGTITNGSAGGQEVRLKKTYSPNVISKATEKQLYQITLTGLRGGHSGMSIHLQRCNGIQLLAQALLWCDLEFEIAEFTGGVAHNVIPREATVAVYAEKDLCSQIEKKLQEFSEKLLIIARDEDKDFCFSVSEKNSKDLKVLSSGESIHLLNSLSIFWDGPHSFFMQDGQNIVRLSNNISTLSLQDGEFELASSFRFFHRAEMDRYVHLVSKWGQSQGFAVSWDEDYPSWPPHTGPLIQKLSACYEKRFKSTPIIQAVHAGLECGILQEKLGGDLEVVSFGPTILDAHSPQERIEIATVGPFWELLVDILKEL